MIQPSTTPRLRGAGRFSVLALGAITLSACATGGTMMQEERAGDATTDATWTYTGATGPERWAALSDDYAVCATGAEQSPIDIRTGALASSNLPPLEFSYGSARLDVKDGGFGVYAAPPEGQSLTIAGERYSLLQFHGHAPSEHTVDGRSYPLEVHFVHSNAAGELAVVGVMVERGEFASTYAPIANAMASDGSAATSGVALRDLLPDDLDYVTYDGSLTTPPCSEGVRWIVLTTPIELSADQVSALAGDHGATNRPVQPLEGRTVRAAD